MKLKELAKLLGASVPEKMEHKTHPSHRYYFQRMATITGFNDCKEIYDNLEIPIEKLLNKNKNEIIKTINKITLGEFEFTEIKEIYNYINNQRNKLHKHKIEINNLKRKMKSSVKQIEKLQEAKEFFRELAILTSINECDEWDAAMLYDGVKRLVELEKLMPSVEEIANILEYHGVFSPKLAIAIYNLKPGGDGDE